MWRRVGRLTALVLVTIAVALVLLWVGLLVTGESMASALGTAAHHLFLFMDIGLGVWVLLLVVDVVRGRMDAASIRTIAYAVIGVVANLLTVIAVGFAQQGALATEFIGFALQAGIAFVLAVLLIVTVATAATRRARHARVADAAK